MIKPTVGRVMWFYRTGKEEQPFVSLVTYVHSDRCVNLVTFDWNGNTKGETSVTLVQERDERPSGYFCEWMPYQKGQAAKTDQLEKAAVFAHSQESNQF